MADGSNIDADGVLRVTVMTSGTPLPELEVLSVVIRQAFNKVPWAELVLRDGDMPTGTFALSDSATFAPGTPVSVMAGYGDEESEVFSGIVVRHGVRIEGRNESRLVVECRDAAVKMTIGRSSANYVDTTDSDLYALLAGNHGMSATATSTPQTHSELVQYHCSDWDFLLTRAEYNGHLVLATAGALTIGPPVVDGAAAATVTWGQDLYAFHADTDARGQYSAVRAVSWDPSTQAVLAGNDTAPVVLNAQGDLTSATLAEVASPPALVLQTSARQDAETLNTWAQALQLKAALARIRGHMQCLGSAALKPGALVDVAGVGARFSGSVFVTGVEHSLSGGQWMTGVEFGMEPGWQAALPDVLDLPAGGLLPAVGGLQIGVVLKLDDDPLAAQRIQVQLPVMQAQTEGVWARLLQSYASSGFGAFWLPEIGDEVIVAYLNQDPSHPVVLGSVYSASHAPPYEIAAENNTKALVTRCRHVIEFDEENKIITVTTPGKNRIVLDDTDQSVLLQDQHDNSVKLSSTGIALDSPYDITLTAKGGITMKAEQAIAMTAQMDLSAKGMNVQCEAQVGFTGKGSASAELSAAGQTTVKGALVLIN